MADTNHLLREHAPIPTRAWAAIDDEARSRLTPLLAARRVADWVGRGSWRHDRMTLGRVTDLGGPPPGVSAPSAVTRQRRVLPLAEVAVPFTVRRREIDDIQRGALDADLADLDRAAREAAAIETRTVFHGWPAAGIGGIAQESSHPTTPLGDDCARYPTVAASAVDRMRRRGVDGPYALAVTPDVYTRIAETTEHGGYPLFEHLTHVLGGPVVWAPGVDVGFVVSLRGGDFLLDVGQDLAIGYSHHDADVVHLYLEETLAFRVVEPEAAIVLS